MTKGIRNMYINHSNRTYVQLYCIAILEYQEKWLLKNGVIEVNYYFKSSCGGESHLTAAEVQGHITQVGVTAQTQQQSPGHTTHTHVTL